MQFTIPVYIDKIENVQKRFVTYLEFSPRKGFLINQKIMFSLCKQFHLLCLANRRMIADSLIKIFNNSIDCPELLEKNNFHDPNRPFRFNTHKPFLNRTKDIYELSTEQLYYACE